MEIGITEPLRKFLRWHPLPPVEGADPLLCWDANRIVVDGCSCLALCNAASRMMGIRRMAASDWRHLDAVCEEVIELTLKASGFPIDIIAPYVCSTGPITFSRTHGRRALAGMNYAAGDIMHCCEVEREVQFQYGITEAANRWICGRCATREDYGYPNEWMLEDLLAHGFSPEDSGSIPVFDCGRYVGPQRPSALALGLPAPRGKSQGVMGLAENARNYSMNRWQGKPSPDERA